MTDSRPRTESCKLDHVIRRQAGRTPTPVSGPPKVLCRVEPARPSQRTGQGEVAGPIQYGPDGSGSVPQREAILRH